MGKKKVVAREEDGVGGMGKSRKKTVVIDDDEYSIGTELSEEKSVQGDEYVAPVGGKKKGKKGNQKSVLVNDDAEDDGDGEGEDNLEIQFTGKKKSKPKVKKGGNSFGASAFALLGDEDDETSDVIKDEEDGVSEEEDVGVDFSGKKKPSKSKKGGSLFRGSVFDAIGDGDDDDGDGDVELVDNSESKQHSEDEDDESVISFTGKKKKSSKSNKKTSGCVFSALDEGENEKESEDVSVSGLSVDDVDRDEEDSSMIKFSGKKNHQKK